uniref:Perforin-1-like n=2 Tax=Echeneis naucrates TaxID=173247 RepID=A0A665UPL9_ECHNA
MIQLMALLWKLLLLLWTWGPLCWSAGLSLTGTPAECEKAPFVPGYNLGGEGFDIVTMERKGAYVIDTETWKMKNGTCRLYINTYKNKEKQKVPVAVVDWRPLSMCKLKVSGKVYDSVETLVNDSTSSVSNDWMTGLNINAGVTIGVSFGGSHSKDATFGMQKSKQDRYNFMSHSVQCNYYRYRLATKPPLSPEFEAAVKSLPSYSRKTEKLYISVIETYGTHYMVNVVLGGDIKAITAVGSCKATLKGLSVTEVSDCLSVEASASFVNSASFNARYKNCKNKKKSLLNGNDFSSEFNERNTEVIGGHTDQTDFLFQGQSDPTVYSYWLKSLKDNPDVVLYKLKPLHTILPSDHPARAGLKRGVEKYIMRNAVLKKCSETCKIGHRSSARDPCECVCNSNENIKANCCPAEKGLATLKVFGLYARNLHGDRWTQTDGSVEVRYGYQIQRTAIIPNNDNPKWKEKFEFGSITLNMKDRLTFNIYDEDTYWNSDKLGECSFELRRGKVEKVCALNHGTFFFTYKVECAPNLGGEKCQNYVPSAMSPSLAKVFYTRNGILAGESGVNALNPIK